MFFFIQITFCRPIFVGVNTCYKQVTAEKVLRKFKVGLDKLISSPIKANNVHKKKKKTLRSSWVIFNPLACKTSFLKCSLASSNDLASASFASAYFFTFSSPSSSISSANYCCPTAIQPFSFCSFFFYSVWPLKKKIRAFRSILFSFLEMTHICVLIR